MGQGTPQLLASPRSRCPAGDPGVFQLLKETTPRFVFERQREGESRFGHPSAHAPPPGHRPQEASPKQPGKP